MLMNQEIPSLFNGVSQQPATLRLPNQHESQVNGYATVSGGLMKRPPFEHVANLTGAAFESAFIHTVNREAGDRFVVVIGNGTIKVFGVDGTEYPVNFPVAGAQAYLNTTNPQQSFSVVSVADFTFIVNKTVTVSLDTLADGRVLPSNWQYYETLGKSFDSNNYLTTGVPVRDLGNVQTFEKLPQTPSEGDFYQVAGSDADGFSSYYVRRTGGVWTEDALYTEPGRPKASTMPHALVRKANGQFDFVPFLWKARRFGDANSNPSPSFIGRTIQDMFFYKNRLGFIADESVVFSSAGDFGNFFRNTVMDVLDSDVVDVAVSHTKVSLLRYAVPFNNGMMLFSDQTQFSLNVTEALTPSTVSIDSATEFEMSTKARPVGVGSDVYFVTESGGYSRIREYFVDKESVTNTATDITAHVPRYIPKNVIKLAANANEDVLVALSKDTPNVLWVYKFFWDENGKVQSAWSHWELPGGVIILDVEILENNIYVMTKRGTRYALERCDIQEGVKSSGLPFRVLLDRQCVVNPVYYPAENKTRFQLAYNVETIHRPFIQVIRGSAFVGNQGALLDPSQYTWVTEDAFTVPGRYDDGPVFAGYKYTFRLTFSEFFVKDQKNVAITTGRLQLRSMTVYFTDSAFFQTEVAPYGNDANVEAVVTSKLSDFTGRTLGTSALQLGSVNISTGSYTFYIGGESKQATITITNDSHAPCNFSSAEWEAFYHRRK